MAVGPRRDRPRRTACRGRTTLDGHIAPTALAGLPARQRLTAALVSARRTDDLLELARWERTVACRPMLTSADWVDGSFAVSFTAHLASDDQALELAAGEDRLSPSTLSDELRARLAAEDLTGPAAPDRAKAVLVLRERASGSQYHLDTICEIVRESAAEGTDSLTVRGTAVLDPATAVSGRALADGAWDFHVRLTALGWTKSARLGGRRGPGLTLTERPHPEGGARTVARYWTKPQEDLSLRVGRPKPPQPKAPSVPAQRNPLARVVRKLRSIF